MFNSSGRLVQSSIVDRFHYYLLGTKLLHGGDLVLPTNNTCRNRKVRSLSRLCYIYLATFMIHDNQ